MKTLKTFALVLSFAAPGFFAAPALACEGDHQAACDGNCDHHQARKGAKERTRAKAPAKAKHRSGATAAKG